MTIKMSSAFWQPVRMFAYFALMLGISGCANMPKGMADSLSAVPGVSLLVDQNALEDLNRRMNDDTISEEEMREIYNRPVPPPPGVSYEVGMLRKGLVAYVLSDLVEVRRIDNELQRNSKNPAILEQLRTLRISSEAMAGNFRQAILLANGIKAAWIEEGRRIGKSPLASDTRVLAFASAVTLGGSAGDTNFLASLLADLPENIDNIASVTGLLRVQYRAARAQASASISWLRGDWDEANTKYQVAERDTQARLKGVVPKDDKEKLALSVVNPIFLPQMVDAELHLGNYAKAQMLLARFESILDPKYRQMETAYKATAANYYGSLHNYALAVKFQKESWEKNLSVVRRAPMMKLSHAMGLAMFQVFAADYQGANATLTQFSDVKIPETGPVAMRFVGVRTFVASKVNASVTDTSALERFDSQIATKIGTEDALIHNAVGVIVHEANFRRAGVSSELVKAVTSGRLFSQSLRRIRATGLNRDLYFPPKEILEAKTAYLAAVSASYGKDGVSPQDLIDAVTLYQESDTDKDMASAALRQKQIPGVSAEDLRKLQELQVAARTAQKELGSAGQAMDASSTETSVLDKKAREAFLQLENHIARLQRQAPALARAVSGVAPTLKDVQGRLDAGEALVIFAPHANGTVAVAITKTGLFHKALPISASKATELVSGIRKTVTFDDNSGPFDSRSASALYDELLSWVQPQLMGTRQLVVVSNGALASIPFGLLIKGPAGTSDYRKIPWLVKSYAITYSPSVGAWLGIGGGTAARSGSFIAWADPDFGDSPSSGAQGTRSVRKSLRSATLTSSNAPGAVLALTPASLKGLLERLPETKAEVDAIAKTLRSNANTDVISGGRATRSSVLAASTSGVLASKSVVMFATHGLAPGQVPGLSQPALAMSREQDQSIVPLLVLDDVIGLRMNADWVVLSACNTSAADKEGGDAMSGLARGFFFAGAKSLLVTHWEVDSESAAQLTVKTMEKYAGSRTITRAQALQQASIELIDAKKTNPEWAHPAFWAPYALVGDGRR